MQAVFAVQVDEHKFPSLPVGPAKAGTPSPAKSAYHSAASSRWAKSPEKPAAAPQHAQHDAALQHAQHDAALRHAQHDAALQHPQHNAAIQHAQHDTAPQYDAYGTAGNYHQVSEHAQPAQQVEDWNQDANLHDETSADHNMGVGVQHEDDRAADGSGTAAKWWEQYQPAGYQHEETQPQQAGAVGKTDTYQQQGNWQQAQPTVTASERQAHGHQGGWDQPQAAISSTPYQPPDTWHQQGSWEQPQQQGGWEQPQQPADDVSGLQQGSWEHPPAADSNPWPPQATWEQPQQQAANDPWQQQSGWDQAGQTGYTDNVAQGYIQEQGQPHNDWETPQEYVHANHGIQQQHAGHGSQQQQQGGDGKGGWEQPSGGQLQWQTSLPQTPAWDSNPSPDRPSVHAERQVVAVDYS